MDHFASPVNMAGLFYAGCLNPSQHVSLSIPILSIPYVNFIPFGKKSDHYLIKKLPPGKSFGKLGPKLLTLKYPHNEMNYKLHALTNIFTI